MTQDDRSENSGPDLTAATSAIWRGKWIIVFFALLGAVLGAYQTLQLATPIYRATAVVVFETDQNRIVDLDNIVNGFSGDSAAINTEIEILRARSLMGKIVDQMDLTRDPEFNRFLQPPPLRTLARNAVERMIGIAPSGITAPTPQQERDATINALLASLSIRNVPDSFVFNVTSATQDAAKSARIADTVVKTYILNQLEVKYTATEQATQWLSARVAELQIELEQAEATVSDFSAGTELVSLDSLQALERQLKELRDRIASAQADSTDTALRLETLKTTTDRASQADIAADPQLDRLLIRAATDDSIALAFDTRFQQILARATLEADRAAQQLNALQRSLPGIETRIETQSKDLITLQQLRREAEASRLLYEYFLGRLKETSAQEGVQQADSRILSEAVVPLIASSPRKSLTVVVSGLLGLLAGLIIVAIREKQRAGFRTATELESFAKEAVLGSIPLIKGRNRKATLNYLKNKPASAAAEAVRNLRTSVILSNVDKPPQVILSTSSIPGEGKTTNAIALAQNFGALGKSVLLIEGDIRRQTFSAYFGKLPDKGLVSALSEAVPLADCTVRFDDLNISVLPGEQSSTNAADLFSSGRFKDMVQDARASYDIIIIDTPPVLVVPDARIIAQLADAVLFTVKWDSTTGAQIDEALRLFRDASLKVTGLILSQISPKGMRNYGYGGKYGAYGGYGAKYYRN